MSETTYATILVEQHGKIISLIGTAGAVALSHALLLWYAKKRPARLAPFSKGLESLRGLAA